MGYDVHITRSEDWLESDQNPIFLDEWKRIVDEDGEMVLTGAAYAATPKGETIGYENEGLALWKGNGSREQEVWFDYWGDHVVVKNPDDEILKKLCEIAGKLNARVLGDEGEEYIVKTDEKGSKKVIICNGFNEPNQEPKSLLQRIFGKLKK